jgi:hypothetical protein
MQFLVSPFHYVRKQRARRRQLQKVLHMLAVSGVVRPSHIEPRYFESSARVDAVNRQEAKRHRVAVASNTPTNLDWTKLRQLVLATRPSRLQTG